MNTNIRNLCDWQTHPQLMWTSSDDLFKAGIQECVWKGRIYSLHRYSCSFNCSTFCLDTTTNFKLFYSIMSDWSEGKIMVFKKFLRNILKCVSILTPWHKSTFRSHLISKHDSCRTVVPNLGASESTKGV